MHSSVAPSGRVLDGSPDHEPPSPLIEAAVARAHEHSDRALTHLGNTIATLDRLASDMGLGLPISRELAHLMGGTLTHQRESELTAFRFRLPLAPQTQHGAGVAT